MRTITYRTKTNQATVKLDEKGFAIIQELGGKWSPVLKRGSFYMQKRFATGKGEGGRIVEMHRYLMGEPEGLYVDHINRDTLDNRFCNLRVVKNSTNLRNGNIRVNNSSGISGVSWDKQRNKWAARIKVNYRTVNLGRFIYKSDAIKARKNAEKLYWSV